jgi:hypothetical protein
MYLVLDFMRRRGSDDGTQSRELELLLATPRAHTGRIVAIADGIFLVIENVAISPFSKKKKKNLE